MQKTKTRLTSLLLSIFMILSVFSAFPALTASAETFGDYTYTILEDGTAEITDYTGTATELEIPSEIEGYTVTSIGINAFYGCSSLISINIPKSFTSIGDRAFYGIPNLTSITIPENVTLIDSMAFGACSSLASITIPSSVTSIGNWVFAGCSNLNSITIPESVTLIGYGAFENCKKLTSITIPDSVTFIDYYAFSGCSNLTSINVGEDNPNYCDLNGILFNKSLTEIISFPGGKNNTEYNIPDSVTSIGDWAFSNCLNLTSINIPESVTSIGDGAFSGCSSLTSITIPDSVVSMTWTAFASCDDLVIYGNSGSYAETFAYKYGISFANLNNPTKLSATVKQVTSNSAKVHIERTEGNAKGAISYALLKGDYSDVDFSSDTFKHMIESPNIYNPNFVKYEYSNYTKNFNFNITNLDRNTIYTVVPFTAKKKVYYTGLGDNVTFTTINISLETTLKSISADTAKFKISRTGDANGALGYVLLKGDVAESYKTLEEYKNAENFLANQTSKWTGAVTVTVKGIESGETYTVVPYTQKGNNYYFGLGENITFTAAE